MAKAPRIIVHTGKGGVGKTSVAAATAVLAANRGQRVLVLSTDIAHSLADSFDHPLGAEPVQIAPNLWGQESDVYYNVRRYWGTIQTYVTSVFQWRGLDAVVSEEMTILPGMDELSSLLWIAEHYDRGDYDIIVVDAAPTGETLRLLSLPEAGEWWLEHIFPIQRQAMRVAGPIVRRVVGMPTPSDSVFAAGEQLFRRLEHLHGILTDPEQSSIRLVLNLEKMVIKEAQRTFTYFHLGLGMLERLGSALFGDADPTSFFYQGRPYRVEREDGEFVLSLQLPFTSKEQIHLNRNADELVVQVGSWRRNLILPRALIDAPTRAAAFEGDTLKIHFAALAGAERR